MSRSARIDIPYHFYHISCRGQRKNPLFFSPDDKEQFILILLNVLKQYDLILIGFCLMTNHYHLFVYRQVNSLGIIMKKINTQYALYFNKKYKTVGHVFQGRCHSSIILNDQYLIFLLKYIHNNPVKAGMVKNPEDYKYSSAAFYNGGTCILPIEKLSIFKGEKGIKRYREFMLQEEVTLIHYKDTIGTAEQYLNLKKRKIGRESSNYHFRRENESKNIYDDLQEVCEKIKADYKEFLYSKWQKGYNNIKIKIINKLIKRGYTQSDIARLLQINRATISKLLKNYIRGKK